METLFHKMEKRITQGQPPNLMLSYQLWREAVASLELCRVKGRLEGNEIEVSTFSKETVFISGLQCARQVNNPLLKTLPAVC